MSIEGRSLSEIFDPVNVSGPQHEAVKAILAEAGFDPDSTAAQIYRNYASAGHENPAERAFIGLTVQVKTNPVLEKMDRSIIAKQQKERLVKAISDILSNRFYDERRRLIQEHGEPGFVTERRALEAA